LVEFTFEKYFVHILNYLLIILIFFLILKKQIVFEDPEKKMYDMRLMRILRVYEAGSGQKLNLEKTSILFSRNTTDVKKQEILTVSGFMEAQRIDTYLGLPSYTGKSKIQSFSSVKDRVQKQLNNWKVKFLSQAVNEVLLKAVVQAIPTYNMSVFQLPATLCKELEGLMQRFWWGHMAKEANVHWMSWEKMGRSKSIGGLGFRDLIMFNKALLAKQGWCLMQNPESLIAQVLRAKYFPCDSFLSSVVGTRPSFVWRSLLSAIDLLKEGLVWRVGDGKSIHIWNEQWLPTPTYFLVQSPPRVISADSAVSTLIDSDLRGWNTRLINAIFSLEEAKVIAAIPLSPTLLSDRIVWRGTKNGVFSVQSAYHLGMEINARNLGGTSQEAGGLQVWSVIWNLRDPKPVKLFMWRACNGLLPTKSNLFRRKIVDSNLCPCCTSESETVFHVLWKCLAAHARCLGWEFSVISEVFFHGR
jgi:hypothetical protein